MYESQFGFSASPFSLNPDPGFYFESKGHGSALSYLRYGVYQGEGFVVVTGEIGAGKTTLLRTLLSELNPEQIVAAQIVSTQLEAGDLLRSVALAFGLAPKNLSKAELIASIEAFLTLLVTQKKRALLVVDEAQNLNLQAIEELRMLSNFQLGTHALLQSYLVGQPELRQLLTSKPMEQFRQRVIASCHLGPMAADETRSYIEHRLRKVGWTDRPSFDETSFERIHHHSGGIPRRVNLLCNRLLLTAYLEARDHLDGEVVDRIAAEAQAEVAPSAVAKVAVVSPLGNPESSRSARVGDPRPLARSGAAAAGDGPLLCVATDRSNELRLAMVVAELVARGGTNVVALRAGPLQEFSTNDELIDGFKLAVPTVELLPAKAAPSQQIAEAMLKFGELVAEHRPRAVLLAGHGDMALGIGLAAVKAELPLLRMLWGGKAETPQELDNDRLLAQIGRGLEADGTDILAEAVRRTLPSAPSVDAVLDRRGGGDMSCIAQASQGFAVLVTDRLPPTRERLSRVVAVVQQLARDWPLVWLLSHEEAARLDSFGLRRLIRPSAVALVVAPAYAERIALLAASRCILCDSADVETEAAELGIASVRLPGEGSQGSLESLGAELSRCLSGGDMTTASAPSADQLASLLRAGSEEILRAVGLIDPDEPSERATAA